MVLERRLSSGLNRRIPMERILLVEDDPHERLLLEEELRKDGYDVVVAANGREAIDCARSRPPQLVIMDIELPEMDGVEALARILTMDSRVPSILYTAYPSYKASFRTWAADALVVKSSDLAPLKQEIRNLLAKAAT
jgi:CheY-like chemotaxis protein